MISSHLDMILEQKMHDHRSYKHGGGNVFCLVLANAMLAPWGGNVC
jgi:hypothetical protein